MFESFIHNFNNTATEPTDAENPIHVIWHSYVIKTRGSGLPFSVLLRFLVAPYHHHNSHLPLVSFSPFLSMFSTLKSLKTHLLPFIFLTSLLPLSHMPTQFIQPHSMLVCFPFFAIFLLNS